MLFMLIVATLLVSLISTIVTVLRPRMISILFERIPAQVAGPLWLPES